MPFCHLAHSCSTLPFPVLNSFPRWVAVHFLPQPLSVSAFILWKCLLIAGLKWTCFSVKMWFLILISPLQVQRWQCWMKQPPKLKLARTGRSCHSLPYVECSLTLELSCLIFVSSLISIMYHLEPLSMLLFDISIIYENKSKVLFVLLRSLFLFPFFWLYQQSWIHYIEVYQLFQLMHWTFQFCCLGFI